MYYVRERNRKVKFSQVYSLQKRSLFNSFPAVKHRHLTIILKTWVRKPDSRRRLPKSSQTQSNCQTKRCFYFRNNKLIKKYIVFACIIHLVVKIEFSIIEMSFYFNWSCKYQFITFTAFIYAVNQFLLQLGLLILRVIPVHEFF